MADDPAPKKRTQHPDLIGLSPKEQLEGLPPLPAGRCGKRNKSCSTHGGGCGYRFKKGDKHWVCPECGTDRRCWSRRVEGLNSCRVHGSGGKTGGKNGNGKAHGHPPGLKYQVFSRLNSRYNQILSNPNLLDMKEEIAALQIRLEKVAEEITEHSERANWGDVVSSSEMINVALSHRDFPRAYAGLTMLLEAIAPYRAVQEGWADYESTVSLKSRITDLQRKWDLESGGMYSAEEVMEMVNVFQLLMFKFIPEAAMRSAFMRILRTYWKPNAKPDETQGD